MRFSDVAAGAFGQPYQHNQLDARLLLSLELGDPRAELGARGDNFNSLSRT